MDKIKHFQFILLLSFLGFICFLLQYNFRYLDDNALTNWKWIFLQEDIGKPLIYLIIGSFLAFFLCKTALAERYPNSILFIVSLALILPLWQEPEVIIDSSRYFVQAKYLKLFGIKYFLTEWGNNIKVWTDLPAVPFFYGLIFKFFGESREYIQLFTTILFISTVLLTRLIGKTLWNREKGFFAGLLLLSIPYLLTQVPLMLVDVPTMFLITLSIYTFLKAMKKGNVGWIGISAISIFLTIFAKYSTWPMLTVIPIIIFFYKPGGATTASGATTVGSAITARGLKKAFYKGAKVLLLAGTFSGAVFFLKYDVFARQIKLLVNYQLGGLSRWQEGFISTFFFQIHPFISLLAIIAVYFAIRKKDFSFLIAGFFALFVFILQIKRIRYILPLFPLFTLMAAYGLSEIKYKSVKKFISFYSVVWSFIILYTLYLPFLQRISTVNLGDAGKYLNSLNYELIEVYTLEQKVSTGNTAVVVPILDLFTQKRIIYEERKNTGSRFSLQRIKKSSLRFTWAFRIPGFYSATGRKQERAVVVISSKKRQKLPADIQNKVKSMKLINQFNVFTGIFRYKTFVRVYAKAK